MSERERWTVYPLLFLALGIALKDKLFNQLSTGEIRCKSMVCTTLVVDDLGENQSVNLQPGYVQCRQLVATERVASAGSIVGSGLFVPDKQGKEQAVLTANADGGFLRLHDHANRVTTFLGNTQRFAGLMFADAEGKVHSGEVFAIPAAPPEGKDAGEPAASEPAHEPAASEPAASEPAANDAAEADATQRDAEKRDADKPGIEQR